MCERGRGEGVSHFLSAAQCAEMLVNGIVAWSGPQADVVIEPAHGMRHLVCRGSGSPEQSFSWAHELRDRLRLAIQRTLEEFHAEIKGYAKQS